MASNMLLWHRHMWGRNWIFIDSKRGKNIAFKFFLFGENKF